MNEMVDRVALAMMKANDLERLPPEWFSGLPPSEQTEFAYRKLARAAIAAMSDPTDAMVDETNDMDDAAAIWRTMIEAALK